MPRKQYLLFGGLALVIVVFLISQIIDHPEKAAELIVTILGTGIAAWVGGWAAFNAERETRERIEMNSRISAANKALFTIATMFNVFDNLRQFYIDKDNIRQNNNRALLMDSPQPGMMQSIHFDFDSINYFLDQDVEKCSMALMELQILDWHYQVVKNTADLRAAAGSDLHNAIRSNPIANLSANTIPTAYSAEYNKVAVLTDQFIELVDEGIAVTKKSYTQMQAALQQQFPGKNFLQINFAEKPL